MKSIVLSVLAILAAAVPGTAAAWLLTRALGLDGIPQALVTTFIAMIISVVIYAGMIALGRLLKIIK
ncbi:MAG: hypothetical protein JNM52_06735 [Betaproteobacteria bacterium]|nr:hypothetical protein [Betaproteobacteria bacterium]